MQWLGTALAALSLAAALPPPASAEPNWSLVWSDEFDDSSLPDWTDSGDEGLGGSLWQPENNGWGGGNQELQFYTPRESNVFVEDGKLTISGIKEVYASSQCPQWTYSCDDDDRVTVTKQYTSARIHTDWCGLDVGFGYGKFEMRAKMPVGKGAWPAFWLMPVSPSCPYEGRSSFGFWPTGGEIDIMEYGIDGSTNRDMVSALHFGGTPSTGGHRYVSNLYTLPEGEPSFEEDFHVFSCVWEEGQITYFIDDVETYKVTSDQWWTSYAPSSEQAPFDQKFYIILNLALGGIFPGPIAPDAEFPFDYVVDYVRVYEDLNSEPMPTAAPTATPTGTLVNFSVDASGSSSSMSEIVRDPGWVDSDGKPFTGFVILVDGTTEVLAVDSDNAVVLEGSGYFEEGEHSFVVLANGDVNSEHVGRPGGEGCEDAATFTFTVEEGVEGAVEVKGCWGECGETCAPPASSMTPTKPGITLYVDLSSQNRDEFRDAYGQPVFSVHAPGSFNAWDTGGSRMSDDDGDGMFEITLDSSQVTAGSSYEFVFTVNGWNTKNGAVCWESCDFMPTDEWCNYGFRVPEDFDFEDVDAAIAIGPFCFMGEAGSCSACSDVEGLTLYPETWVPQEIVATQATIQVDMRHALGSALGSNVCPATMNVVGEHNNWSEWGAPLTDEDGDGIFEGTIDVDSQTPTQYQILMVQGQWSSPIITPPQNSGCDFLPDDNFYNFGFVAGNDGYEVVICPGYCSVMR
ncbi:hypothetical protein TeGR_g5306 [Tetraparma gracilis]|uniref:GH16 domain-containing protein n=1 Tax=Tetraparma gracilis TaxID=2962635 RepID=A0ABQ6M6M6_9STRA|nr:hypothetical protein TeGR_g5306 [Tetraparma gracilis]